MKVKEYNLFKTLSKTEKENNLFFVDSLDGNKYKRFFDFSLLEENTLITENEKEVIVNDAVDNVNNGNKISFYGKIFNNFSICGGTAKYYCHKVYSITGKHLYSIFQLAELDHYRKERKTVYDNYNVQNFLVVTDTMKPLEDIEI